jgi:rhamnogalacturonan endolyase
MNFLKPGFFILLLFCFMLSFSQPNVTAMVDTGNRTATMSNGLITLTANSKGQVNTLTHNGKELLEAPKGGRFYFSYNDQSAYYELSPTAVRLQKLTDDYAEVVYSNTSGQLIIEQAFILRKGISGIYCYVTVKGTSTQVTLREMRLVYRVSPSQFTYGYVTDRMQGELPSVEVMAAVDKLSIMDATYPLPDGTIYTKYDWTNYLVDDSVHGILSDTHGLWAIPVSHEYANGGPMKQELTVHATNKTPLVLQMLQGEHFGAAAQVYSTGDEKIYGPFFIYINSGSSREAMIEDARQQASLQKAQWPFQWLEHPLYPTARTTVSGKLSLHAGLSPEAIQVVLAKPGATVYNQGKDYIFWSKTDANGNFSIAHVRPGTYTLYAYATQGEITDELALNNITVSGSQANLGTINWQPKKYEHMLWHIGENNRLSDGYRYSDTLRRYGLYEFPPANLTYTIGTSKPETDWYYAQTKAGSWSIDFDTDQTYTGNAVLTASIAGAANSPSVTVYVNGSNRGSWSFTNDACIYRSAVLGGRHGVKTLTFPASLLVKGKNTVKLTMSNPGNRGGVMYDCLKLETGGLLTNASKWAQLAGNFSVKCFPNPVADDATFEVSLPYDDHIGINVINAHGKHVARVFDGKLQAGVHSIAWQPVNLPAGVYYLVAKTTGAVATEKILKVQP